MNENNFETSNQEIPEAVSGNTAFPVVLSEPPAGFGGSGLLSVSGSDAFETVGTVSDGNGSSGMHSVSMGDINSPFDNTSFGTLADNNYTEQITQVTENLTQLCGVSVLIFLFLIFSWTEKRIHNAVHNFTKRKE